jgi:hypothetical protein
MKAFNSFLIFITAAVLAGCSDKSGSQGANSATNGFAGYVNSLGQAQKSADKTIDVTYLNQAVQQFNVQEGRYPKTLEELTPNYVAKIPDAPMGYKLDYDATTGEVKIVPQ